MMFAGCSQPTRPESTELSLKEILGKRLFFDESLSEPAGQSCATCHDPKIAFADPEMSLPVSRGAVHGLYGSRNDMTVSYSMYVP
ncbi:MAG: cytochrome-c peroxidase, partial [Bacteroidales bacterium]|nr:cytochrome-c peroxidase [Bacteroidales bacterium]